MLSGLGNTHFLNLMKSIAYIWLLTMASNSYLYRYLCKNAFIFSCCLWPFWLWLFWLCYTESWKRGLCICNRQADTTGGLDCTIQGRQMPNTCWKAKTVLHTGMGIWKASVAAALGALWSGFIMFASKLKSRLKCIWIYWYAEDVKHKQHLEDINLLAR